METLMKYPQEIADQLAAMFCSKEELRPKLMRPFIYGEMWVATDAHLVLLIPGDVIDDKNTGDDGPDVERIFNGIPETDFRFSVSQWDTLIGPLPELKLNAVPEMKTCPVCNGEGDVACYYCGHEEVCNNCDGAGKIKINPIDTQEEKDKCFFVGAGLFGRLLLAQIVRAVKLLGLSDIGHIVSASANKVMRIEFEGGIVFGVMPRRIEMGTAHSPSLPIQEDKI